MKHHTTTAIVALAITLTAFSTTAAQVHSQQQAQPVNGALWLGVGTAGVHSPIVSLGVRVGPIAIIPGIAPTARETIPEDGAPVSGRIGYTDFTLAFYGGEIAYCHDFDAVTVYAGGGVYQEESKRKYILQQRDISGKPLGDFYSGNNNRKRTVPTATVGIQLHVGTVALVGVDASLARGVSVAAGVRW